MGMEKARGSADKLVAVIGDSTFFHSGITGLIDMVYNIQGTVIILDNSTTGMTGHQDHPPLANAARRYRARRRHTGAGEKYRRSARARGGPVRFKALEQALRKNIARTLSVIITRRRAYC